MKNAKLKPIRELARQKFTSSDVIMATEWSEIVSSHNSNLEGVGVGVAITGWAGSEG